MMMSAASHADALEICEISQFADGLEGHTLSVMSETPIELCAP